MNQSKCFACGRTFYDEGEGYCSFQCSFIASTTRRKFYDKKYLRWYVHGQPHNHMQKKVSLMKVQCKNCGKDFDLFASDFCSMDCTIDYYLKPWLESSTTCLVFYTNLIFVGHFDSCSHDFKINNNCRFIKWISLVWIPWDSSKIMYKYQVGEQY